MVEAMSVHGKLETGRGGPLTFRCSGKAGGGVSGLSGPFWTQSGGPPGHVADAPLPTLRDRTSPSGGILDIHFGQRADSGGVERRAVDGEVRSVTGAVPTRLERIPVQVAADMRAGCGAGVQLAGSIAVGGDLADTLPDDGAVSGLQLADIGEFARREVFGKVLYGGHVLAEEI